MKALEISLDERSDQAPESTIVEKASKAAWFALWVLVAVCLLRWVDQVVLVIGTEPMKKALNLSDLQIGLLQGLGLTMAVAIGSVPLAWLADRTDRRLVLAGCILFWSAATAARGFSHSFEHIMMSTVGMSLADAGLYPIAYAIIALMFHGKQRITANLIFYAASSLGYSVAMALGGFVFAALDRHAAELPSMLQGLESWRTASFAVAIVGPLFALLVVFIRLNEEQPFARKPKAVGTSSAPGELRHYLRNNWRALVGVYGSAALGGMAFGPLLSWLPPAIARRYDLSPSEVGSNIGTMFLVSTMVGLGLAGLLNRFWGRRFGESLPVRTAPYLTAFSAIPLVAVAFVESANAVYAAVFLVLVPLIAFNAGMPTVYQGIAPRGLRATVMAGAMALTTPLVACGPILVGYVSDGVADRPNGLLLSCVAIGVPFTLLSAWLIHWAAKPIHATLEVVRRDDASRAPTC